MKKSILCSLIITALVLMISSCKQAAEEGYETKEFKDINGLFVINTTNQNKNNSTSWISIDYKNHSADPLKNIVTPQEIYFEDHTAHLNKEDLFGDNKINSTERKINILSSNIQKFKKLEDHDFELDITKGRISAQVKYIGKHCYIWQGKNEKYSLDDSQIEELANVFDSIYEKEVLLCGPKYAGNSVISNIINPNDKISILLTELSSRNIYGCFHSATYTGSAYDQGGANQIETLFINSYYARNDKDKDELYSVIVHEFNHMLNYANKYLKYGLDYDTWYTEMLSLLAQDFFINELNTPFEYSSNWRLWNFVQGNYRFGFGNWGNIDIGNITDSNYACAFAFGAYLARNYGGAELIHEIATNEYTNQESVEQAVKKVTGKEISFDELFCEFTNVLINLHNEDESLPSLYKEIEQELVDSEDTSKKHTFTLNKIDLSNLPLKGDKEIKIISNSLTNTTANELYSYGFQYYVFPEKADVTITYKDFLRIQTF